MSDSDGKISGPCPICGKVHRFDPFWGGKKTVPLCDPCEEWQELHGVGKKKALTWEDSYRQAMPDEYQLAEIGKIPPCYASALDWTAGQYRGGLGLIGPSGEGKSCAIACLLRELKQRFIWLSGAEARDAATQSAMTDHPKHADACILWEKALKIPILVLDDITQGVMTTAWSSKLLALLETRKSRGLPTFWTSQMPLPELREKLGRQNGGDDHQADAISRRLGQDTLKLEA